MALSVDSRKIVKAEVVPWEEGEWGVAWETAEGHQGADRVGKKSTAQRIVDAITVRKAAPAGAHN